MPIISAVGSRSFKVRALYGLIFLVLSIGALTMIYPLTLMLTGSVNSESDATPILPYPRYWFNDEVLFAKYAESRYDVGLTDIAQQWWEDTASWLAVKPPSPREPATAEQKRILDTYLAFRDFYYDKYPDSQWRWYLGQLRGGRMLPINGRLFREAMYDRFQGDLEKFREAMAMPIKTWNAVDGPNLPSTRYNILYQPYQAALHEFALTRPRVDRIIPNLDGWFFRSYLLPQYQRDIKKYNAVHGTNYASYRDVYLTERPPRPNPAAMKDWEAFLSPGYYPVSAKGDGPATRPTTRHIPVDDRERAPLFREYLQRRYPAIAQLNTAWGTTYKSFAQVGVPDLQRKDWESFVRRSLKLEFIRIDASAEPAYRRFLANSYAHADQSQPGTHPATQPATQAAASGIDRYNAKFHTTYRSFDEIPLPTSAPQPHLMQVDWDRFLKDFQALPTDAIEVFGPRQEFEIFYAKHNNLTLEQVRPLAMPVKLADWHDMAGQKGALRWEFSTRNYKQVLAYILLHGNGLINTVIYCGLAILTALLVNPLAAYALSRYKLPSTYTVLLFCMATMAFPGEVTMIPGFLLLKRFPLFPILGGAAVFVVVLLIINRLRPKWDELLRMILSLAVGIVAGAWLVPMLMGKPNVSLLNTFSALVLPNMASGFSIFLLKGFFDSLPAELYEAADIDGASEWTKFWTITMSLSKPILAVIALSAFTHAYSAFMMALIIIPDQSMWTIMVWLFQLQQTSHQSVRFASLVLAAVPTFLVFAFCQNLIMRGIVVPVEK